ncbi:phosphatase PAP2 family protein [Gillisia sp. Hel_I_29]|uniref:phosphatase PAP2 family protein n=1 Tax=Gillisia sp. Hel_I_29 TaxID=1249975 RepID=UPI000552382D|nr:phosphatase PAP2 family protein [Gillisia sp. Hel_I_29]
MRQYIYEFIMNSQEFIYKKFNQKNSKWPYFLLIFFLLIVVVVGINIFIELTDELTSKVIINYDSAITNYVISYRTPSLNKFMQFITNVGDIYGYLILAAVFTLFFYLKFKNWRYVIQMLIVLGMAALSNSALKQVINRARPDALHLVSVQTLSYPSGHAMSAIAFYGFMIYLSFVLIKSNWLKYSLIFLFSFLIVAIGISRIYLGVHYPSDIAGGYIAGFIWVVFCITVFNIVDLFRRKEQVK